MDSRLTGLLVLLDVLGFVLAANIVYLAEADRLLGMGTASLWITLAVQLLVIYVFGLYAIHEHSSRLDVLARTLTAVLVAGLVAAGAAYTLTGAEKEVVFDRGVLVTTLVLFFFWTSTSRYAATVWMHKLARRLRWLVISDAEPDSTLCGDIAAIGDFGDARLLLADSTRLEKYPGAIRKMWAGTFDSLFSIAGDDWSGIVIAAGRALPAAVLRKTMELRMAGTRMFDLTEFYERFMQKVPISYVGDQWFVLSHGFDLLHRGAGMKIKRVLDVAISLFAILAVSPVAVIIAAAIFLDLSGARGPVIYRQLRTGYNKTVFYIYKFRTMVVDAEKNGAQWASTGDVRITPIGRFLRHTRLDELPQLWNVLKGEMSFIGPRPERPDMNRILERQIPYYDLRHVVKPGITGWAQVMYPYGASIEDAREKLQYDIYYIKNYSLFLDLLILVKTLKIVLQSKGR